MTDSGDRRAEDIFREAARLPAEERARFIDEACRTSDLRDAVLDKLETLDGELPAFLASAAATSRPLGEELETIGPYRLLQRIGEGGFGVVYMAQQDEPVRRRVALKVLKPGMDSREVVIRFEAERQALAMMTHPNIASIIDVGETESGRPYFVMELVKGLPINELCDRSSLSLRERIKLVGEVCHAVEHAHQKGIIHRDLKPSNILVGLHGETPTPKIIDFGIAKALNQPLTEKTLFTRLGQMVGTPAYMSPEQADLSGLDVDTRSDVYSLGVLLYELLTGTTPLEAKRLDSMGLVEIQRIICEEDPPTPSTRVSSLGNDLADVADRRKTESSKLGPLLRGELDWIVMRALEKDRGRRYQSASELAADLERYLNGDTVEACPPTVSYRLAKFARRHRVFLGVVTTVLVVLAAATAVSLREARNATDERNRTVKLAGELEVSREQLQKEKTLASANANRWRRQFYGANLLKAKHFLDLKNGGIATEALDECPEDLRGWEWRHLRCLADQSRTVLVSGLTQLESARFSPDGDRVLSALKNGVFTLRDAASGKEIWSVTQANTSRLVPQPPVFTPDGSRVITAGAEEFVLRDAATGKEIERFGERVALAFHLDGRVIRAVVNRWEEQPCILSLDDRSRITLEGSTRRMVDTDYMYSAAFSPDGRLLATGRTSGTITIWDSHSGARVRTLRRRGAGVSDLEFTGDGRRLSSVNWIGALERWDVATGELIGTSSCDSTLRALSISPGGHRIVTGESDSTINLWDAASGELVGSLRGHGSSVTSVHFRSDGKQIVSASIDGSIRIWDSDVPPASLRLQGQKLAVTSVAFDPGKPRLASGEAYGVVRVWDATTGQELWVSNPGGYVTAIAYSPAGTQVTSASRNRGAEKLDVWNAETGEFIRNLKGSARDIWCLCYSPDGSLIAASGRTGAPHDASVHVWDTATGEHRLRFIVSDSGNGVVSLMYSGDGSRIVTASSHDRGVRIWDAHRGSLLSALSGPKSLYHAVAFSPGGQVAAGCMVDNQALIWNVESGEVMHSLRRHRELILSLCYSPDGRRLFTTGSDSALRIWDAERGEELLAIDVGFDGRCVAVSADGRKVAVAGYEGIQLWDSANPPASLTRQRRVVERARSLVDSLSASHSSVADVIHAMEKDTSIDAAVERLAIETARTRAALFEAK